MAIDGQGFVWAATESGLNRLSGKSVMKFKKSNSDITSDDIVCLHYVKHSNQMWIGSKQKGISIYNCSEGTFESLSQADGLLSNDIADITSAVDNGLWILHRNKGIQHYDFSTRQFRNITEKDFPELGSQSRVLVCDNIGHLYVGHFGNGLSIIDLNKGTLSNFRHKEGDSNSIPSDFVRAILIDSKQNIWIGTNNGVAHFNPLSQRTTVVDVNGKSMAGSNIHGICEMRDGAIWFASDFGGITILKPYESRDIDNSLPAISTITVDNSDLSSPNIRKFCEDSYGNIWVGNYSSGIDFIASSPPVFGVIDFMQKQNLPHRIYGIASDNNGNVWMGGESLLAQYSRGKVIHTWDLLPYVEHKESMIYVINIDREGNLWLGINDVGVLKFDIYAQEFSPILMSGGDVHAFYEDADGKMWIGTENMLYSYSNGQISDESDYNKVLGRSIIYALTRDVVDRLWVGTLGNGIYIFDRSGKLQAHLTTDNGLPSNNINQIYEDNSGALWIATYEGLAEIPDIKNLQNIRIYSHDAGLDDVHVRAISEDLKGNLWISTYTGVSSLKRGKKTFDNYDYSDGLPDGGFVENGVAMRNDGMMFFSSPNGVGFFNPQLLDNNPSLPELQIISIESLNNDDNEHLLFIENGKVSVPYDENSLRFKFTVKDYSQINQVQYAYMIEGMDDDWQFIGSETSMMFKNLPYGKYIFKFRAKNKNGEWNDKGVIMIPVEVTPPLWLTWYAKLGYLIILIVVIYLSFLAYRKRLLLRNKYEIQRKSLEMERKQRQDEQDLNNERMRFYTNIAHELRTPLTLVIGPLEDLTQDKLLPKSFVPQIQSIHSNSIRLLNLVNQIMEFRKTETQNKQLTVAKGSLPNLVTEIGLRYKELYKNEDVEFLLDVAQLSTPMYFDREIITTIITNFISNAIKYTSNGHIKLSLSACMIEDVQYACISVEDTGYGIDADVLPHIYERYFQAKGKHQASGTGIGLALVKSLAELHLGKLSVESKLGVGSTFSFMISTTEIYPNALHKETSPKESEPKKEASSDVDTHPIMLVVEDNADIREYIIRSFCKDFAVLGASNGKEGLELTLQNMPDIIISDIMMPEIDGIELCKTLKCDIRTSHIPVILLTAKDTTQDKEEGYESGADSYLTKPFSAKLLRVRVHNLLEGRKRLSRLLMSNTATTDVTVPSLDNNNGMKAGENEIETPQLSRIDEKFLKKLNDLIEQNITTEKLDMVFFTDKMNMSHSTFYRKLKVLTGLTPVDYIRKIKLKKSVNLLGSPDYNISEIAYMTGFNSPAHYREAFKDEYGMTPTQYIKQKR